MQGVVKELVDQARFAARSGTPSLATEIEVADSGPRERQGRSRHRSPAWRCSSRIPKAAIPSRISALAITWRSASPAPSVASTTRSADRATRKKGSPGRVAKLAAPSRLAKRKEHTTRTRRAIATPRRTVTVVIEKLAISNMTGPAPPAPSRARLQRVKPEGRSEQRHPRHRVGQVRRGSQIQGRRTRWRRHRGCAAIHVADVSRMRLRRCSEPSGRSPSSSAFQCGFTGNADMVAAQRRLARASRRSRPEPKRVT